MTRDDQQALLTMTGEQHIDEYGKGDEWGRGGVHNAAGKFDLGRPRTSSPTALLLFMVVSRRL